MSPSVPPISVIRKSTALPSATSDPLLDLIGDVGDHLHGGPRYRRAALFLITELYKAPAVSWMPREVFSSVKRS